MDRAPDRARRSAWSYLRRYRGRVALGLLCLVLTSALAQAIPWLLKLAVDALSARAAGRVTGYAGWIVAFAVGQALIRIASRWLIFDAARQAEFDLRNDAWTRLLALAPSYFRRTPTGDLLSRLSTDVMTMRVMWGPGLLNMANTVLIYGVALALMLHLSPTLTLYALAPYPLIALVATAWGRRLFTYSRRAQEELGALSAAVEEDLAGISVVKAYAAEPARAEHFRRRSEEVLDVNVRLATVRGQMMPILGALGSLGTVIVLWLGGRAVAAGEMTLGALIAFNAYLALLVWPTLAIGWILSLFQRGLAAWQRVAAILAERPTIVDGAGPPLAPDEARGRLEVRGLTIAHEGRKLLDDVSLEVAPGTTLAVVGRTGSGKSTLVEAVARLVEVPPGTVFLDGRDVTTLPLAVVRGAIGYAPQDAFLFSATIAENVAFGQRGAAAAEGRPGVERAARAAGLERDLAAFPDGLDTLVGERGITLSGGQRQRVALARAFAARPRVLILDDSLSSVDAETEREILAHLDTELAGRTAILVSHRVAAVQRAHQIVVLDEGRVVERGTHEELIARGGPYAELCRRQLEEAALAAPAAAAGGAAGGAEEARA